MDILSPAISIVGRHNSGKTTLIEKLIAELVSRGLDVGSVKHHGHVGFDIDIPGKDSYRHRAAGASETVIAAPGKIARVKTTDGETECLDIVRSMPNHDIVIVEGYRKSALPTIEVMRADNPADERVAEAFAECVRKGLPLSADFVQMARNAKLGITHFQAPLSSDTALHDTAQYDPSEDFATKMPTAATVAVVTDIEQARTAAESCGIPVFDLNDITELADFVQASFVRPKLSIVIQAGGESRRMGQSKATVPFLGRPLICRLVERLSPLADELIITTNEPENLHFLANDFPELNIHLVRDVFDTRGALLGLYTALHAATNPLVGVVACDMACASARLICAEALDLIQSGADAAVPRNQYGYEPFHSVYRRDTCLASVAELIDYGHTRASDLFGVINVNEFTMDRVREAEPEGWCFVNANTPDELHLLEKVLLKA
ncbi:molybdopterin-guanine dinucleotide biosynthesis protein B [Adlercreutzia sp. ZJ138]|uniref:molybdopterin-guanine dinucleotide biosynthesis protein B n=1 Tax=Adlercreutzia sp. ZJ138 TaxID=2709405 RepID=UPI0013ECC849|nr:molybdopterin-guanine dinucleotide biosynthesis protein B [Adlercreutzia sp. ZJ138]